MEQLFLVKQDPRIGIPEFNFDELTLPALNMLLKAGAAVKSITPIHGSDSIAAYVLLEVPDGIDPHEAMSGRKAGQSRSSSFFGK